jgi:hypothetical protein
VAARNSALPVTLGVAVIRALEIAKGNNEGGSAVCGVHILFKMNHNSLNYYESLFISLKWDHQS